MRVARPISPPEQEERARSRVLVARTRDLGRGRAGEQLLEAATLSLVCAKFALIASSSSLDFVVLGVALGAVVVEVLGWRLVLTRPKAVYEIYNPDEEAEGPSLDSRRLVFSSSAVARYGTVSPALLASSSPGPGLTGARPRADTFVDPMADDASSFHSAVEDDEGVIDPEDRIAQMPVRTARPPLPAALRLSARVTDGHLACLAQASSSHAATCA